MPECPNLVPLRLFFLNCVALHSVPRVRNCRADTSFEPFLAARNLQLPISKWIALAGLNRSARKRENDSEMCTRYAMIWYDLQAFVSTSQIHDRAYDRDALGPVVALIGAKPPHLGWLFFGTMSSARWSASLRTVQSQRSRELIPERALPVLSVSLFTCSSLRAELMHEPGLRRLFYVLFKGFKSNALLLIVVPTSIAGIVERNSSHLKVTVDKG